MICPVVIVEPKLQVNDKTRISAKKSYVTKGETAITKVEIKPEVSASYVDVTGDSSDDWWLDYQYAAEGDKTVSVRVNEDDDSVKTATIEVVTASDDNLFSSDADLIEHESDIMNWLPDGRSSFLNMHRAAQKYILEWLDRNGYVDIYENKFTVDSIVDITEVNEWSTFTTLRMIYQDLSNTDDDDHQRRADRYEKREVAASHRALLRIDVDGDGEADTEGVNIYSADLFRR